MAAASMKQTPGNLEARKTGNVQGFSAGYCACDFCDMPRGRLGLGAAREKEGEKKEMMQSVACSTTAALRAHVLPLPLEEHSRGTGREA